MGRKIKILLGSAGGIAALITNSGLVFAQLNAPSGFSNLQLLGLPSLVGGIIRLLLILAFVIAFLFLLFGGIRWILSGGDKAGAESARGTLTAALIGLVIVLAAWLIITIIETLFGIPIISTPIVVPPLYNNN